MTDRLLLGPSVLFATVSTFATAVSLREPDLPGEMVGVRTPGSVRLQLALGLGSGIAAPWPVPLLALRTALGAAPGSPGAAGTVAALGALDLVGVLIEPVTWGRRPASRAARATVPLHLLSGAAMVWAGTRRLREAG